MELTLNGILKDRAAFEAAGYKLPSFDYDKVSAKTKAAPTWIHFGAGNIFRAFQCNVAQNLLNAGVLDTGIIAVEGFDYEIIEKMYRPHDNLTILATLKADNTVEKTIVGSIMESLILDSENEAEYARLKEIFAAPSLQMASFTITEKGYAITDPKGNTLPAIAADFAKGPEKPASYLGKVVSLLYHRYVSGKLPIAMVSMDNCSHNGDKLAAAVTAIADAWCEAGLADAGFAAYVRDPEAVSYPWSMIDKIRQHPFNSIHYHPVFEKLNMYDMKNNTELCKTFCIYMKSFKNLDISSKKLNIHRNTLKYRLERIKEISNVDLDDPHVCMLVLCGCYMKELNSFF